VKRMAAAVIMSGAAWMGLSGEAQAQVLIMPMGPLSLRAQALERLQELARLGSESDKFTPVARWAGGTRILRSSPPRPRPLSGRRSDPWCAIPRAF
jgi:hypothetical protein